MTDLRKAAEKALDVLRNTVGHSSQSQTRIDDAKHALVQALEQPEQEPVEKNMTLACPAYLHGYTAPPKREWVGLTRAERFEIERAMSKYYDYQHECKTVCLPEFAAAIEAKLKEKNGG